MAIPKLQSPQAPMPSDLSEVLPALVSADRRFRILQLLSGMLAFIANDSVLKQALLTVGHAISSSELREELRWLEDKGFIHVECNDVYDLHIARLTERGQDVVHGLLKVSGVASDVNLSSEEN